jgi:hypothetical protein
VATVPVGMRLARETWERHSAAAQLLGLPLGVYLRQRLEEQDRTATALAELRDSLERGVVAARSSAEPAGTRGLLVEMLLILRQLAGPQRAGIAHKEAERLGLQVWK